MDRGHFGFIETKSNLNRPRQWNKQNGSFEGNHQKLLQLVYTFILIQIKAFTFFFTYKFREFLPGQRPLEGSGSRELPLRLGQNLGEGTSLVTQWLRICLAMQRTQV